MWCGGMESGGIAGGGQLLEREVQRREECLSLIHLLPFLLPLMRAQPTTAGPEGARTFDLILVGGAGGGRLERMPLVLWGPQSGVSSGHGIRPAALLLTSLGEPGTPGHSEAPAVAIPRGQWGHYGQ